jgi:hypothetical protein
MSIYWLILVLPVFFGLSRIKFDHNLKNLAIWLFGLFLIILIGFRHEVGGDWFRYLESAYGINKGDSFDFLDVSKVSDYGYRLIHWFSINYLNGIYSTNFISATLFVFGLSRFSRLMPIPWIALFVSIPFLVIVVSMGYTRQSIAVGFALWGLVDLINGKTNKFYFSIIVGALFHYTVVILIPVGMLYAYRYKTSYKKNTTYLLIILFISGVYMIFGSVIDYMVYYYVTIKYHHSDGAFIRVVMNSLSAIIFFLYRKEFKKKFNDERLWFIFSVISIVLLPIVVFYSTLIDRIAIYFIPLQLVVLSRIPVLIKSNLNRLIFILSIVVIYALSLFVWLNFGNYSTEWLPYRNMLVSVI